MFKKLLPTVVTSLVVGAAVTFFLPFVEGLLGKVANPTIQTFLNNRIVQIVVVGLITSVGIGVFTSLASAIKLEKA